MGKNDYMNNRSRTTTHTLMSGGIIGIPDDKYQDFLEYYSREVGRNKSLTFPELRSFPVSKMYFDVDLLSKDELGDDFTITLASTIQRVIRSYYTEENGFDGGEKTFQCVVCTTPSKIVTKDEEDLVKNGFHIIFPFLNIDIDKAYQMRYNAVYELERVMGKREIPSNPWADAIDRAPYKGGLKMCGSFKMVNCSKCKNSKKEQMKEEKELKKEISSWRKKIFPRDEDGFDYSDLSTLNRNEFKDSLIYELNGRLLEISSGMTCPFCTKGKCIENRTYMPTMVLDSDGTNNIDLVDYLSKNMYETMKHTSIRCQVDDQLTPGYKRPMGVPACPNETNSASLRNLNKLKIAKMDTSAMMEVLSEGVFKNDEDGVFTWRGPQIFDDVKKNAIEKFLRGLTLGPYSKLQVKTIFEHSILTKENGGRKGSGTSMINSIIQSNTKEIDRNSKLNLEHSLLVRVMGEGSTYCANKQGEHTSNSIYFRFTPQFCYQKCFSRKDEVRPGGKPCGFYRSSGVELPYSLAVLLFPNEDIPVPPMSTISFSRTKSSTVKQPRSCPSVKDQGAKKPRVHSLWGNRSLGSR